MSNIIQELEAQIRNITTEAVSENVGTIKSIGDGVAHIEGLSNAMLNEMIEFPGGLSPRPELRERPYKLLRAEMTLS